MTGKKIEEQKPLNDFKPKLYFFTLNKIFLDNLSGFLFVSEVKNSVLIYSLSY